MPPADGTRSCSKKQQGEQRHPPSKASLVPGRVVGAMETTCSPSCCNPQGEARGGKVRRLGKGEGRLDEQDGAVARCRAGEGPKAVERVKPYYGP